MPEASDPDQRRALLDWVNETTEALHQRRRLSDTCVAAVRVEGHPEIVVSVRPSEVLDHLQLRHPRRSVPPVVSSDVTGAAVDAACRKLLKRREVSIYRINNWRFTVEPASGRRSSKAKPLDGMVATDGALECADACEQLLAVQAEPADPAPDPLEAEPAGPDEDGLPGLSL